MSFCQRKADVAWCVSETYAVGVIYGGADLAGDPLDVVGMVVVEVVGPDEEEAGGHGVAVVVRDVPFWRFKIGSLQGRGDRWPRGYRERFTSSSSQLTDL